MFFFQRFTAIFLHGTFAPQLHQAIKSRLLASPLFHHLVRASQSKSNELISKGTTFLKKIQDTHRFPPK